jgi:2-oxoglutarate ferredoxin oxidoreductase subunit delta
MAKVTISETLCKGCGLCVDACPKKILALGNDKINAKGFHPAAMTAPEKCIGCAFCATMCPDVCIVVEK